MKRTLAPKHRTAALLGAAAGLLAWDLVLIWHWLHPAASWDAPQQEAVRADELAAQVDEVTTTLSRLAQRLPAQPAPSQARPLLAEYSAQAVQGAEPSMELSQLMAEGLTVVAVGARKPVVLLGERAVRVGDVLPDGSRVVAIDRHGLTTKSPQGTTGRLQGFGAISMPASSPAATPDAEDTSTQETK